MASEISCRGRHFIVPLKQAWVGNDSHYHFIAVVDLSLSMRETTSTNSLSDGQNKEGKVPVPWESLLPACDQG